MALTLTNTQRKLRVPVGTLRKAGEKALSSLGFPDAELCVLITGETRMRSLNREFRGKDKTTDVLSFPAEPVERIPVKGRPQSGGGMPPVVLGDVVICAPRAAAQAARYGHSVERELVFLLIHGILHLAGYDHEKGPAEERAMRDKQRDLMARLNVR